jgi:3-deoxy-manno-octulosonate cytidylyltransferase (CMP-KDO synthetase)
MSFTVLIPARLASTRLPDKPLADIAGRPMIVHVAERAARSGARQVVVAADDTRTRAILTRVDHATGSDRLAEASVQLGLSDEEIVLNVQGDEPLIDPDLIDACAALLAARSECVMATAAHAIDTVDEFLNPNVVKVICDAHERALTFSRAPLPWWRDGNAGGGVTRLPEPPPLRHVGLYAYRTGFLRRYPRLSACPLETLESLEQLRVLWHGERIAVHLAQTRPGPGVDTPEDLERVRRLLAAS